jgi:hypothetical protein
MTLFTLHLKATFVFNFVDSSAMLVQGAQQIMGRCLARWKDEVQRFLIMYNGNFQFGMRYRGLV